MLMVMNLKQNALLVLHVILLLVTMMYASSKKGSKTSNLHQKTCMSLDKTIRAKHKSCLLRPDTGPCRADILSWYFDAKQERCYRFFWGGCQGNGNRYTSRSKCIKYCHVNSSSVNIQIPHFCNLAFDYGTCFGQYNRWGWDTLYKTCRRRLYSGCGGNQNNFETKMECMSTCISGPGNTMTRLRSRGLSLSRVFLVWLIFIIVYCNCVTKKPNGRTTLGQNQRKMCLSADTDRTIRAKRKVCLLRPDTGPCRADVIAWYYDARNRKCYRFFWGGCQGNGNNFVSEEECKENCFLSTQMTGHMPYFCTLAYDYGTCFGQYNRWTWDHVAGICKRRLYSGCGGNQNNFETKEECLANCLTKPNNTLNIGNIRLTTCIPFTLNEFN